MISKIFSNYLTFILFHLPPSRPSRCGDSNRRMIHCVHYWSVWSHNLLLAWQIVLLAEIWPGHGPNIKWHLHSLPVFTLLKHQTPQVRPSPGWTVRKYQNKNLLFSLSLCIESNHWSAQVWPLISPSHCCDWFSLAFIYLSYSPR